ncbi:MAG: hypothetical protein CME98_23335 [Hyphomonas sp.]|nr:hypothetical protein [Hyphomonas sp.]
MALAVVELTKEVTLQYKMQQQELLMVELAVMPVEQVTVTLVVEMEIQGDFTINLAQVLTLGIMEHQAQQDH